MLSITDVPGIASTFKKMSEVDPSKAEEIKKYQKSLKEQVERALRNNQSYLHENIKVNGKSLKYYSIKEIKKLMMEANSTKIMLTNKLKDSTLNESVESKRTLKDKIANKIRLISLLDEELTYRVTRKNCLAKLNEEEDKEDKGSNGDFSEEDLSKMFGGNQADNTEETEEKKDDNNEEEEVVDLARVVITMEDKDAAEELKKSCLDAGIPEDAIEIEEESEEESEEEKSDESEEEESEESEEKEQPNESVKYKNLKRLFEDEETEESDYEDNAEESDEDTEDSEESEEEEEKEGAVKFILTDTDYIKDLAKILDDEYGISKEEFEEMIGGEIVDEDEESDEEATEEDADKEDKSEDSEDEDKPEDDIDPSELFKGL